MGASADSSSLGGRPAALIRRHGYSGRLFLVNPRHSRLGDETCYASLGDLPEVPDLALIIVPASAVPAVLRDCVQVGTKAAVILSAGFAEQQGSSGQRLQQEILSIARAGQVSLLGPNSEGFLNVALHLPASFSPVLDTEWGLRQPALGDVGVVSQSGALGFGLASQGAHRGLGFSYVVTTGNEADIDALDVLEYLIVQTDTRVVLLVLEALKDVSQLPRIAGLARDAGKSIVCHKLGRSVAGGRATASHTAHVAGAGAAYTALLRRNEIGEAARLEELLDAAISLSTSGRTSGSRIAVLSTSGGAGIVGADACEQLGFAIPELSLATQDLLRPLLPPFGSLGNPVDLTAQVIAGGGIVECLKVLASSGEVDGLFLTVSLASPGILSREREELGATLAHLRAQAVPFVLWSYTTPCAEAERLLEELKLPWFATASGAASGLRASLDDASHSSGSLASHQPSRADVQGLVSDVVCEYQVKQMLEASGIRVPRGELAAKSAEAVEIAGRLGYPVCLKAQSPAIMHKARDGCVALNLCDPSQVAAAADRLFARCQELGHGESLHGLLVEAMVPMGAEVFVGVLRDEVIGPYLALGSGGQLAELVQDKTFWQLPLSHADYERLRLSGPAAALEGLGVDAREEFSAFLALLTDFVVGQGAALAELDLNPVMVHPDGAWVVDALMIRKSPAGPAHNGAAVEAETNWVPASEEGA
ncbi:MAG: acetate--CoA ligase family protein [Mycobacteriales bacterium]